MFKQLKKNNVQNLSKSVFRIRDQCETCRELRSRPCESPFSTLFVKCTIKIYIVKCWVFHPLTKKIYYSNFVVTLIVFSEELCKSYTKTSGNWNKTRRRTKRIDKINYMNEPFFIIKLNKTFSKTITIITG